MNETQKNESRNLLARFIQQYIPTQAFVAKVISVDENAFTCKLQDVDSDAELLNVRLTATNHKHGVLPIPAVNSYVVAASLNNNPANCYVALCSEITKYIVKINDNIHFVMDANGVVFNGGNNNGMLLLGPVLQKLNNLENRVNLIQDIFNTHVHTSNAPTTPTSSPVTPIAAPALTTTTQQDIENTKIKQ